MKLNQMRNLAIATGAILGYQFQAPLAHASMPSPLVPLQGQGYDPNQSQLTADQHFRKGVELKNRFNWPAAYKEVNAAYRMGKKDAPVIDTLVELMVFLGKPQEAEPIIRELASREATPMNYARYAWTVGNYGDVAKANSALEALFQNQSYWSNQKQAIYALIDNVCPRTINFTCTIDPRLEKEQKDIYPDIRVPIPQNLSEHQKSSWSVTGAASYREETLPCGNRCVRVTPASRDTPFTVKYTTTLKLVNYEARAREGDAMPLPEEVKPYLQESKNVNIKDPRIVELVAKLKDPKSSTQTVINILNYHNSIARFVPPGQDGNGSASDILTRGYGHCESLHSLAVTLLRAAGIPARYLRGYGGILGDTGKGSHHTITEYYLPNVGWISWDDHSRPLVTQPNFVSLFYYNAPFDGPIAAKDRPTFDLMLFQRVGLACEYQQYTVQSRSLPK